MCARGGYTKGKRCRILISLSSTTRMSTLVSLSIRVTIPSMAYSTLHMTEDKMRFDMRVFILLSLPPVRRTAADHLDVRGYASLPGVYLKYSLPASKYSANRPPSTLLNTSSHSMHTSVIMLQIDSRKKSMYSDLSPPNHAFPAPDLHHPIH